MLGMVQEGSHMDSKGSRFFVMRRTPKYELKHPYSSRKPFQPVTESLPNDPKTSILSFYRPILRGFTWFQWELNDLC